MTVEARGGRAYLEIPPHLNLGEWVVDRHVREGRGGRPAVHAGDRIYSYADLARLSNRAANALGGLGIGRGDRVLLRLGTNLDCMLAFLGALKLGAVPIPTSLMLRAPAEEVRAHARRVIAPYKAPHEVTFVAELPKTLTGKVLRRQLRAQG